MTIFAKVMTVTFIGLVATAPLASAEESLGSTIPGTAKSEPPRGDSALDKASIGDTGGTLKSEHGGDTTLDKSIDSKR